MQEHKSFLIRDLLGDVLSERVHGKSVPFISVSLDAGFARDSLDRDAARSMLLDPQHALMSPTRTRVDGETGIFIGRGCCRVAGNWDPRYGAPRGALLLSLATQPPGYLAGADGALPH